MGLLTKIFGNRDDQSTEAGEASEEHPLERSEERPLERSEERPLEPEASEPGPSTRPKQNGPRPAPAASGRLTFAAPSGDPTSSQGAGNDASVAQRRQRRAAVASEEGGRRRSHEVARGRIARPVAPTLDVPALPRPIPDEAPRDVQAGVYAAGMTSRGGGTRTAASRVAAAAGQRPGRGDASHRPEAEDPEEIDVSDQLEAVDDMEDELDAAEDLIIEDDEDDEDDEETSTSVAIWGAAAPGSAPASSDEAVPEPPASELDVGGAAARELESATGQTEPEPARPEQWLPDAGESAGGHSAMGPEASSADPEVTAMDRETTSLKRTVVAEGTELTGTLKSSYPVVINGTLHGDIDAPALSVASSGVVHGTIRANTLRSQGMLAGTIEAGEAYVSGTVRSQTVIRARRLEVKLASAKEGPLYVTFRTFNVERELPSAPEAGDPPSSTQEKDGEREEDALVASGWDLPVVDADIVPARASAPAKRGSTK